MRKTTFTKSEFSELKKLVSKKVFADRSEQKKIRNAIRKIGFHFSDFSSKKGYDVNDLDELVRAGNIKIIGTNSISMDEKPTTKLKVSDYPKSFMPKKIRPFFRNKISGF